MDTKRIPIHLVTGFLGSGKTTAIVNWLKTKNNQEQWAVLINEFGKVSIDFETLSPKASDNEKVYNVSGGCICCSAKDYFEQNLLEIIEQQKFDRILIEPSGLGGADMISSIIKEIPQLELQPVICLLSAKAFEDPRMNRIPLYRSQIINSDVLLVSHCDLFSDELERSVLFDRIKKEYPGKSNYWASCNGDIDWELMLTNQAEQKQPFSNWLFDSGDLSDSGYQSESFEFDNGRCFDENKLRKLFEDKGVLRSKGYIQTRQGWKFYNYTLSSWQSSLSSVKDKSTLVVIYDKTTSFSATDILIPISA